MATSSTPNDVTTGLTHTTASATGIVDATPADVFDFLRRPANHVVISGDETVKDTVDGPELLEMGSTFGMKMRMGLPYRIRSTVKEFEQDKLIAWSHFSGHRWRWQVEPAGENMASVTETFDMTTAHAPPILRLMGYPKKHVANVKTSVENVIAHFAKG